MSKTAVTGSLIDLQIDPNSALPKYQQIAGHLRGAIEAGRIPTGIKLPSTAFSPRNSCVTQCDLAASTD